MRLSVTYILIGINILIFAAETMAGGSRNRETALRFGAMYPPYIQRGQWYRMFMSMFLHFGFLHLICNMYSLYNLGPGLEYFLGVPLFLLLYVVSGLSGNILSYLVETRSGRYKLSAGASGAIFGLLGAYLLIAILPGYGGVSLYGILHVLLINAVYTVSNRSINAMAHLGGLIGGILTTLIILFIIR